MPSGALHGLLIVDKPGRPLDPDDGWQGDLPTSHDVVKQVRRWSRQGRIGHTGTLDPMASGLLVLCMGVATRLVEYYQGHNKTYEAQVTLGSETDTYDAVGQVVTRSSVPEISQRELAAALDRFRGEILQRPPIYSALKQGGESLHRKARRGEKVEVAPRPTTIHEIQLLDFVHPGQIMLRISCSAGTYIRSLAHDLGQALGTVGHLSYLRRTHAGAFSLAQAQTLDHIERAATDGHLSDLVQPPGYGLQMPRIVVNREEETRLGQGQKVPLSADISPDGHLAAAVDEGGTFLGVIRPLAASEEHTGMIWKAEKWLAQQRM